MFKANVQQSNSPIVARSGTAVANLLPGGVEAAQSQVSCCVDVGGVVGQGFLQELFRV